MGVVGKVKRLLLQHPFARHKHALVAVDQNVFYFGVSHQVIQRPEPGQFFVQGLRNPLHFLVIDGEALLTHKLIQLMMNELTHAAGRPFAKHCTQFFHAGQQMFMRHVLDEQQLFGVREQRAFIGENNVHAHSPFLQRFAH